TPDGAGGGSGIGIRVCRSSDFFLYRCTRIVRYYFVSGLHLCIFAVGRAVWRVVSGCTPSVCSTTASDANPDTVIQQSMTAMAPAEVFGAFNGTENRHVGSKKVSQLRISRLAVGGGCVSCPACVSYAGGDVGANHYAHAGGGQLYGAGRYGRRDWRRLRPAYQHYRLGRRCARVRTHPR